MCGAKSNCRSRALTHRGKDFKGLFLDLRIAYTVKVDNIAARESLYRELLIQTGNAFTKILGKSKGGRIICENLAVQLAKELFFLLRITQGMCEKKCSREIFDKGSTGIELLDKSRCGATALLCALDCLALYICLLF